MIIIAVFALSFVSLPLYLVGIYAASFFHVVGFSLYLIVCWAFAVFYLNDGSRLPVVVVGIAYVCVQSGEVIGGLLMLVVSAELNLLVYVLSSALLFVLIAALIFIFLKQQKTKHIDYRSYLEVQNKACEELAEQYDLTKREVEILFLIAQKKSNGQIVSQLFISQNTLKTHLRHIYTKASVHNRSELLDLIEEAAAQI